MFILSPGQVTICKKKKLEEMYCHINDHHWSLSYKWVDAWDRFLPYFSNWCGDLGSSFPGVSLFFPHSVTWGLFRVLHSQKETKERGKEGRLAVLETLKWICFWLRELYWSYLSLATLIHTNMHTHRSVAFWKHSPIFISFRTALLGSRCLYTGCISCESPGRMGD